MWNLDLYGRLARADAWAIIGPVNWYGPSSNIKLMFDRLVCMNGGNPRPDLIDKKDALKAQALERSPVWRKISRNHLSGRTAAFFCYGDDGAAEEDGQGRPTRLEHPEWFDADRHPMRGKNERDAYLGLVWQCRYSDIEVPDQLWGCTLFGVGKPYADDQVDDMMKERQGIAAFDDWVRAFVAHVEKKGLVPGTEEAERSAQTTTNQDNGGLAPEKLQRSLAAIDRIGARRRGLCDSAQGAVMLALGGMAFIVAAAGRVSTDHQKVFGGSQPLMACAGRLHDHIAGFQ
jgi:hypothetical protein